MPKANPSLDMTPMVDLAFLLVTFFMLTASVRVSEPVVVDTPSSTSDKLLPENVLLVSIDRFGKAFFNISNPQVRINTLERMGEQHKIQFTNFTNPICCLSIFMKDSLNKNFIKICQTFSLVIALKIFNYNLIEDIAKKKEVIF